LTVSTLRELVSSNDLGGIKELASIEFATLLVCDQGCSISNTVARFESVEVSLPVSVSIEEMYNIPN